MNKKVLAIASIAVFVLYVTSIFYSSYIVLSFNDKNLAATPQQPLKIFGGSSENRTTSITTTTTTTTTTGFHSRVNSDELFDLENIPTFMKDYFEWHRRQLQIMKEDARKSETDGNDSEENDDYLANHRFLVLRCAGGKNNRKEYVIDRCGGLSDRLKPLPLFLWYAATTNRILFIRWDKNRPAPIETFMMPGNTWNWTIPDALLRKIDKLEENIGIDNNNGGGENFTRLYFDGLGVHQMLRKIGDRAVWMIEGNDYSGGYTRYANFVNAAIEMSSSASVSDAVSALKLRPGDAHYENFYHDLFHITFRPSSGVQTLLSAYFYDPKKTNENIEREKMNEDTGDGISSMSKSWLPVPLQRNRYAVAHYRAKYPGEPYRETQNRTILREITIHAVECAKSRASGARLLKNPRNKSSSTTLAKGVSAVYFASDTALAVEAARDSYHNHDAGQFEAGVDPKNAINVWTYLDLQSYDTDNDSNDRDGSSMKTKHTITLAEDPPHLNFAKRDDMSAFNGIFVDMFLMSYASCVVYGAGGFGNLGSLVSYRPSCGMPYTANRGILKHCDPYD